MLLTPTLDLAFSSTTPLLLIWWGASLGKWDNTFTWKKWDCDGFAEQTAHFVKRGANGSLQWGFEGKNQKAMTSDITGRITLQPK